jgi:tetratricopeptide (TPR) repeat protein
VESLRVGVAAVLARSFHIAALDRAVQIDPANPKLHRRLGFYYLDSMQNQAPQKAVHEFRLATELDPLGITGWTGLAEACDAADDPACADGALARALKLSPMTPRLYWQAGLNFITANRPGDALPYFRRLLQLDPQYDLSVYRVWPGALENADLVLRQLLTGADVKLKLDYLNYLSDHGKDKLAGLVWAHIVDQHRSFPLSSAAPFVQLLLNLRHVQKAKMAWQDLARMGIVKQLPRPDAANIVFNSGFETPPADIGFDWHIQSSEDALVSRDTAVFFEGKQSLRIDFPIPANDNLEPIYELVPVQPNQAYRLTGYVRSDSITSTSGPRLRVLDPFCPARLDEATAPITGTTQWQQLSMTFSTGPNTRLIRLSVWRPRCRSFPFEITGTFWIDDVSITGEPAAVGRHALAQRERSGGSG